MTRFRLPHLLSTSLSFEARCTERGHLRVYELLVAADAFRLSLSRRCGRMGGLNRPHDFLFTMAFLDRHFWTPIQLASCLRIV